MRWMLVIIAVVLGVAAQTSAAELPAPITLVPDGDEIVLGLRGDAPGPLATVRITTNHFTWSSLDSACQVLTPTSVECQVAPGGSVRLAGSGERDVATVTVVGWGMSTFRVPPLGPFRPNDIPPGVGQTIYLPRVGE